MKASTHTAMALALSLVSLSAFAGSGNDAETVRATLRSSGSASMTAPSTPQTAQMTQQVPGASIQPFGAI